MKTFRPLILVLLATAIIGCESEDLNMSSEFFGFTDGGNSSVFNKSGSAPKATGSIEFVWKGGGKKGEMGNMPGEMGNMPDEMGNQPDEMRAFFEFNAHEAYDLRPAKGEITFSVTTMDLVLHREIKAQVFDVKVDKINSKAYILAKVISDTKGCSGGSSGGHDSSCGGDDHPDGDTGCGDDSTDHDGGCSHDETDGGGCSDTGTDGGGCSDTGTDGGGCSDTGTDGGGCSDTGTDGGGCSDTGTDGSGCSESDSGGSGGSGSDMGSGSPGGEGMGNPLKGRYCRTGQIIVLKVHDKATPGINGDGITWKWFSGDSDFIYGIGNELLWPKLCKKTILAGNIVVHP